MGIEAWSTTAADNDDASPNGAPEGMAPSGVNDTMRQIMASVRAWFEDAQWINFGHVPTRIDNDTFTVPTDLTAIYHAGRRLKVDGSATGYCTIASSSFGGGATTVNVTMDSGNLPATLSTIYVSILTASNTSLPHGLADYARLSQNQTFTGTNTFNGSATSVTGSDLSVARSASGSTVGSSAENTSNTASSNARLTTKVAGTSAGDAIVNFEIASTQNFTAGIDNSDSDIFKIQAGSSLSGTSGFSLTTGNVARVDGLTAGYRDGNTVTITGNHTLLDANRGKLHFYNGSGGHTISIPDGLSAAGLYPFLTSAACTVAIAGGGAGSLNWATGAGFSTGSRSIAAGSLCNIIVSTTGSNNHVIGGNGIS